MRKFYFVIMAFLLVANCSFAQVTYNWIGGATGDYTAASNWSPARTAFATTDILSFDALSTSIAVSNVPNQTIGAIKITQGTNPVSFATNTSGNALTLTAALPLDYPATPGSSILVADFLTMNLNNSAAFTISTGIFGIAPGTGGKININGALILSGGTLNVDVPGTGGTIVSGTGSVTYNSGVFTSLNTSAITWQANSNYYHAFNGSGASAIPASIWAVGATCSITGMNTGTTAPTGLSGISFYNFVWNCPLQFNDVDLNVAIAALSISGTFTVTSTNSTSTKYLRLAGANGGSISANNYSQTAGNVMIQSSNGTTTFAVSGLFSHLGGKLDGVGNSGAGSAILDLKGDVVKTGIWQSSGSSTAAQMTVQFSGSAAQSVSIGGVWVAPVAGRCNIVISNSNTVTGVTLTAGSVLQVFNTNSSSAATCSIAGILTPGSATSVVKYTGTLAGALGTTLVYNGAFFQNATATEFPITNGPANLTINNTLGVTFPAAITSRSLPGTLNMVLGNLALGSDTLSLTNLTLSTQLSYTGGFVTTGTLARYIPTSGLPTNLASSIRYPFGSGVNDRSLNLYFSAATLTSGTAGFVYVTHTPIVGVTSFATLISDNGVDLDKRTDTKWTVTTASAGGFDLGTGGETIGLNVIGANIGSVDNYLTLRLTDGVAPYGILSPNPNTGTNIAPSTGKSGLLMSDINKAIYIGSDGTTIYNPLINITFIWTGASAIDGDWTRAGNWTGLYAVGYPSASTEIAIINTVSGSAFEPVINTGTNVNLYQLTVSSPRLLTMIGNAGIKVYDTVRFTGTTAFAVTSTFGYGSSNTAQKIVDLPYGGLSLSGTAAKILPATITVTGAYNVSGVGGDVTTNSNTFIYAGTGSQTITPGNYYNLTFKNDRANGTIKLGGPANNTIDVRNIFDVSALTNFKVDSTGSQINFSNPGYQFIPGFIYNSITNANSGGTLYTRTLDPLGSANPAHVIKARTFDRGTNVNSFTVTGSKVNLYVSGTQNTQYGSAYYNDLTISGDLRGFTLNHLNNSVIQVYGAFDCTVTNFKQGTNVYQYVFNGTADQKIPGFKTNVATNTPAFNFSNVTIQGGNRNVTLAPKDTIGIRGNLTISSTFTGGKGFIVDSSTVSFNVGSSSIPVLTPSGAGTKNYWSINVNGGTKALAGNMTLGGNLSVNGVDTLPGILNIGDGNNARILNVLGNISASGSGTGTIATGQIDMNTGTNGSTKVNLSGNLLISGNGQLMGTTSVGAKSNGVVIFNGTIPQTYNNTSTTFKNGIVNFIVGDGSAATSLTLAGTMNLLASAGTSNRDTLTVCKNAVLDCGTKNIISNGTGTAAFNLQSGAMLITSNGGGVEGNATGAGDGSIYSGSAGATIVRTYNDTASYTFNGVTATPFSTGSSITKMANLTIGANVTLDKSIKLSNTLTLGNSVNFNLSNSDLTLRSTAVATARVAVVPATATLSYGTGRFDVERYYPARRSWRLVTAPLTNTGTVYSTWQNNGVYQPGIGTLVTGLNPDPVNNGLDYSQQNNYSLKMGSGLTAITNTKSASLSANLATSADNLAYFLFVRGDRDPLNTNISNYNITTLSSRGKIQTGGQTFPTSPVSGGFTLIGNPFASPVDFKNATRNNLSNRLYVYDPYLNQVGGYVLLDDATNSGNYTATPPTVGNLTNLLQSSQAFFVETNASGPSSLVFDESAKSSGYNTTAFRPAGSVIKSLRTNLYLLESNNSTILADGNLAQFDNSFSKEVGREDALKFGNTNEMFSIIRGTKALALERRPEVISTDTLFFKLTKTTQRNYQFEFQPANMDATLTAYLEDSYTATRTPVALNAVNTVNFTVNGDAKSAAADRFRIVFTAAASAPLPVTYSSIKAYQRGADIAVDWTVENEINIASYAVEKSNDGTNFSKFSTIAGKGGNGGTSSYSFLDVKPAHGNNFYRILSYSKTGTIEYSRVVVVKIDKAGTGISIYPNPVKDNMIGVAFSNMEKGVYGVRLINTLGQELMTQQINHSTGSSMEILKPAGKLSTGIYQLEITAPDNSKNAVKVVVQ